MACPMSPFFRWSLSHSVFWKVKDPIYRTGAIKHMLISHDWIILLILASHIFPLNLQAWESALWCWNCLLQSIKPPTLDIRKQTCSVRLEIEISFLPSSFSDLVPVGHIKGGCHHVADASHFSCPPPLMTQHSVLQDHQPERIFQGCWYSLWHFMLMLAWARQIYLLYIMMCLFWASCNPHTLAGVDSQLSSNGISTCLWANTFVMDTLTKIMSLQRDSYYGLTIILHLQKSTRLKATKLQDYSGTAKKY